MNQQRKCLVITPRVLELTTMDFCCGVMSWVMSTLHYCQLTLLTSVTEYAQQMNQNWWSWLEKFLVFTLLAGMLLSLLYYYVKNFKFSVTVSAHNMAFGLPLCSKQSFKIKLMKSNTFNNHNLPLSNVVYLYRYCVESCWQWFGNLHSFLNTYHQKFGITNYKQ
jgi:hypothetical protein